MKEIEKDAAVQQEVHHPNDPNNFDQELEEINEDEILDKDKIFTYDDLMKEDQN